MTPSGLQYKDLREGTGETPQDGDTLVVDWWVVVPACACCLTVQEAQRISSSRHTQLLLG